MANRYNTLIDTLPPILAPQYLRISQDFSHTGLKVLHVLSPPPAVLAGPGGAPPSRPPTPELGMCMEHGKDISQNAAIIACLANIFVDRAMHVANQSRLLGSGASSLEKFTKTQIVCWGDALVSTNLSGLSIEVERLLDAIGAEALSDVTFPTTLPAKQAFCFFNLAKQRMQEERDLFVQQLMDMFSLGYEGPADLEGRSWSALEFLERAVLTPAEPEENEKSLFEWMDEIRKAHREALLITWDTSNPDQWRLTFHHNQSLLFQKNLRAFVLESVSLDVSSFLYIILSLTIMLVRYTGCGLCERSGIVD